MGKMIKQLGWRRESIVVSTKIFWGGDGPNDTGLSHKHIIESVNNALRRIPSFESGFALTQNSELWISLNSRKDLSCLVTSS